MLGRGIGVGVALLLTFFLAVARADAPEGPRLAVITRDGNGTDLFIVDPNGGSAQVLISEAGLERPSWSADGRHLTLAVSGYSRTNSVAAVVGADGTGLRVYRRAYLNAGDPVMAPNGRFVVYPRTKLIKVLPGRESYLFKASIWRLDLSRGSVRRLTRWRVNAYLGPSSFSPDGKKLAATLYDRRGVRAVAIDLNGGDLSVLARDALEPTYAPDGVRFAFVRPLNWEQSGIDDGVRAINELRIGRVGSVAGGKLLLRRRGALMWPSWDPSGERLAFTHSPENEPGERSGEWGDRVMSINVDGSCLRKVASDPDLIFYGSTWQPGPGREAGRIHC